MAEYFRLLELLLELIGLHPRRPEPSEQFIAVLRAAGWRRFHIERVI